MAVIVPVDNPELFNPNGSPAMNWIWFDARFTAETYSKALWPLLSVASWFVAVALMSFVSVLLFCSMIRSPTCSAVFPVEMFTQFGSNFTVVVVPAVTMLPLGQLEELIGYLFSQFVDVAVT